MAKLFPPKYGSADPMGPEPKNPGEGSIKSGSMYKFAYDPANVGSISFPVYADATERDADPRLAKAPNGTAIIMGTAPQTKIGGAWKTSTVT